MNRNWIKLHRKITGWEWYTHPATCHLFIHLILSANYKPTRWRGVEIKPGQLVTGRKQLSKQTGLSEQTIRTSLKKLIATKEVTSKSTSKFSIITIINYSDYQLIDGDNQPNIQPATNQQLTTSKKDKKKNIKLHSENASASTGGCPNKCDPEQWEKYLVYSKDFLERQHERLGKLVKVTNSKVISGAKALDNLIRVRKYDKKVVAETIEWAIDDDFWGMQLRSLGSLTKKGRNDEIKFDNILAKRFQEELGND